MVEEKYNAYSHFIGVVLAVFGAFFLLTNAYGDQISTLFTALLVYCIGLIFLFSASTIYHSVTDTVQKRKLRVLDHIGIYYLIAGTYTPICLFILKDSKGILLLYLVWGLAFFGTLLKIFFTGRFEVVSLVLYAIMGWLVIIDINGLIRNATSWQLLFLGLGGFFYTIGIVFYAVRKIPFNHFIWHIFVLAGAACHFFMIYSLV